MILFGVFLAVFMFSGCQQAIQSSGKVEKFKKICDYRKEDFRLAEDVKYFSLSKLPHGNTCQYDAKAYQQLNSVEKQALKYVKKDLKSYFRLFLPPNACVIGMPPSAYISYMDKNSKVHMVTNKKELKTFLGNIDTPAEVKIWLMLNGKIPVEKYEKRYVDYRAWFCGKNYLADNNGKCAYVVTPHGKIEKQ